MFIAEYFELEHLSENSNSIAKWVHIMMIWNELVWKIDFWNIFVTSTKRFL